MEKLNLESVPLAISIMAEQIDEIKSILSEKKPQQDTSKKHYSLAEAAKFCNMAEMTFRKYIYDKKVGGTKFAKAWLFLESDLEKFINDHRRPTAKELKDDAFEKLTNSKR